MRRSVGRTVQVLGSAAVLSAGAAAPWGTSPGPAPGRPSQLRIAPDVRARLDVLALGLKREIALCLLGRVADGRAVATDLYMPVPVSSTATTVVTGPCPARTVATWHNHPSSGAGGRTPADVRTASARGAPTVDGWSAGERSTCRPSQRDVSTAVRLRIPFLVIADGIGEQCVWPLERLEALVP